MGTRHLIAVVVDGDFKVAQYGQWDGYPDGQGADVLQFLTETDLSEFRERVSAVRWLNDEDVAAANAKWAELGADISTDWVTMDQSRAFYADPRFASLSRDVGAKILGMINEGTATALRDDRDFATDSLFCEWAYVVDLDENTFEVYEGFNKGEVEGRWAGKHRDGEEYAPVTRVAVWSLDALPTQNEFLRELSDEEDEE